MAAWDSVDATMLAAFTASILIASVGLVLVSGFFPASDRPTALRGKLGGVMIWLGLLLTLALASLSIAIAVFGLPLAHAVVFGGAAFLLAPFLVQPLPGRFRDSICGIGAFVILGLLAIFALHVHMTVDLKLAGF